MEAREYSFTPEWKAREGTHLQLSKLGQWRPDRVLSESYSWVNWGNWSPEMRLLNILQVALFFSNIYGYAFSKLNPDSLGVQPIIC